MAVSKSKHRVLWGLVGVAAIVVAVYGAGRLLTSNVTRAVGVDFHAGKIEARNNSTFSHSKSWSGDSVFEARRIAIQWVDDHPVLEQVIARLRDDMRALAFVDEVDVFGPGETYQAGERLYDSYLTISIDVQRDSKPFVERDFSATIGVTAGTMPYHSRNTYHDHLTVPNIQYALNAEINHTSLSTQAGKPYKMIADNIGEELAGKLTEQFAEWHEEFGGEADWPDDLIGRYPEDRTIPWPEAVQMEAIVDGYGLMQHRHALWRIETDQPRAVMQAFHQAYTDAGWRIDQDAIIEKDERNTRYHFRAWNDAPHQVEVFEVRDRLGERDAGEVSLICVRYQHRFDRPETRAVIDRLLDEDADLSVLRCLQSQMASEQRARYFQLLADSNPTDPRDYLALAAFHHRKGQDDEAKRYLTRAALFIYRAQDRPAFRNKITKAAKDMGFDESLVDPSMSPERMTEFGYKPLDHLVGTETTIDVDQAVQFYFEKKGDLHTMDLWLAPDHETPGGLKLHHYERHGKGSSSWGSGGGRRTSDPLYFQWQIHSDHGEYTVHFREMADAPDRFSVEVTY